MRQSGPIGFDQEMTMSGKMALTREICRVALRVADWHDR